MKSCKLKPRIRKCLTRQTQTNLRIKPGNSKKLNLFGDLIINATLIVVQSNKFYIESKNAWGLPHRLQSQEFVDWVIKFPGLVHKTYSNNFIHFFYFSFQDVQLTRLKLTNGRDVLPEYLNKPKDQLMNGHGSKVKKSRLQIFFACCLTSSFFRHRLWHQN